MASDSQPTDPVIGELRKLRRMLWLILVFCAGVFLVLLLFTPVKSRIPLSGDSWLEVQAAIDRLQYDRAFAMAKRITARFPNDHYGYAELGHISLILGDVKAAESYYTRAYQIYPGENYTKIVTALRNRLPKESPSPQAAATP
jgi:tetratricopeptide (TPR) repeat protein